MILVAGDIMLDVLLLSQLQEEEQSRGILIRSGGSAANTAAWVAALGQEVVFLGCIGDDSTGSMLQKELRAAGVDARLRRVSGWESGAVVVEIGDDRDRVMRSARGANEALGPADLQPAAGAAASVVHLTGYALLAPEPAALLKAAAAIAHQAGALLSFDPSSRGVVARVGGERLLELCERCGVDLFLPNRSEADALTGAATLEDAVRALSERFRYTIVKDGRQGAVWATDGQLERLPACDVSVLDTTGAGDAFDAGVIVALAGGESLGTACAAGHEVAARAVSTYGGRPPRV